MENFQRRLYNRLPKPTGSHQSLWLSGHLHRPHRPRLNAERQCTWNSPPSSSAWAYTGDNFPSNKVISSILTANLSQTYSRDQPPLSLKALLQASLPSSSTTSPPSPTSPLTGPSPTQNGDPRSNSTHSTTGAYYSPIAQPPII